MERTTISTFHRIQFHLVKTPQFSTRRFHLLLTTIYALVLFIFSRSQGMGISTAAASLGATTVPWVAQWLQHIHFALPFAIMAGFGIAGASLNMLLPETNNLPTLETFEGCKDNKDGTELA